VVAAVVATPATLVEALDAADGRQRLGWAIVALTLLVGALMARTLPMRRQVRWGPTADYLEAYAGFYGLPEVHGEEVSGEVSGEVSSEVSGTDARGNLQPTSSRAANGPEARVARVAGTAALAKVSDDRERLDHAEVVAAARRRRLRRGPEAKRRPPGSAAARGGTATGVYGPLVRRAVPRTGAKNRSRLSRARGGTYAVGVRQKKVGGRR
jgi:hypothetical protein